MGGGYFQLLSIIIAIYDFPRRRFPRLISLRARQHAHRRSYDSTLEMEDPSLVEAASGESCGNLRSSLSMWLSKPG
jgi:hypothetical protein